MTALPRPGRPMTPDELARVRASVSASLRASSRDAQWTAFLKIVLEWRDDEWFEPTLRVGRFLLGAVGRCLECEPCVAYLEAGPHPAYVREWLSWPHYDEVDMPLPPDPH